MSGSWELLHHFVNLSYLVFISFIIFFKQKQTGFEDGGVYARHGVDSLRARFGKVSNQSVS